VLVVDGLVSGLWQRTIRPREVVIRVEPLVELTPRLRASVESAAHDVAAVLERSPEVEFGPIDARPHL
jgi:hypothetical protein